jgi:chromate reductase
MFKHNIINFVLGLFMVFSSSGFAETKVLALSGSTRASSFNTKLVNEAAFAATKEGAQVIVISLKDYSLPFYDADLEAGEGMPEKAKQLRQLMIQSDVIMIAGPEYNASLSAILKNMIDWSSRSEGKPSRDAFKGKKFLIMSATPGAGGGARGLAHLRAIIEAIGGVVIAEQITVPNANTAFDSEGRLVNAKTNSDLQAAVKAVLR